MLNERGVWGLLVPGLLAVGVGACAAAEETHKPHWSYEGEAMPAMWGKLDPTYVSCEQGQQQSPVELTVAREGEIEPLAIAWQEVEPAVVNNGHTIQVNLPEGSGADLGGTHYQLLQFHFHHPSEHTVDGRQYPLEVHFVHKSADGLMVLGVFVEEGKANPVLQAIWDAAPSHEGEAELETKIDPANLLPANPAAYRYAGSLTTPPCSEIVTWLVYAEPIQASVAQIAAFAKLFPNNFRPVQPLNRRFVLKNF